jgi:hypothetical protein
MKKARSQIYLALGMVLLSGCATRFAVDVSGFANREKLLPVQATYVLLPVQGKENDLAFQEYAGMVGKKLDARGYKRTDIKSADLAIFLAYGIDDGKIHNYAYSMPAYGTTTFSGTSFGSKGITQFSGSSSGIVGTQTMAGSYAVYTRLLIVDVVDLSMYRENGTIDSLWKGEISSRGSSDDIRLVMPVLIEAGFKHFGQNTQRKIRHVIFEGDNDVEKLRKGN